MQSRSLSREIALLVLGQISEDGFHPIETLSLEVLLQKALDTLMEQWREDLDACANEIQNAQNLLQESDLQESVNKSYAAVRDPLSVALCGAEKVLNSLSASVELPRLLALADQESIRLGALERMKFVLKDIKAIDLSLDDVMEGWRLKRLPRIDRDILRLAVVDLKRLNTPAAVSCNEAVELANRYSDEQGRRMINGVLRRLQNSSSKYFS